MMLKNAILIAFIAGLHFSLCIGVIPVAMSAVSENAADPSDSAILKQILVWTTRILHFPIITLSLYSRQWFPGDWIYLPIFANSALWALGVYLSVATAGKVRRRRKKG